MRGVIGRGPCDGAGLGALSGKGYVVGVLRVWCVESLCSCAVPSGSGRARSVSGLLAL